MTCTVVTAFYSIPSKFPSSTYFEWGQRFLTLESPIVFFTDSTIAPWIREKRGNKPIHIVEIPFESLEMWIAYQEKWKEQHAIDPEKRIHSPELYAIWAQKTTFVEQAIHLNPFQTDFFFWCDVGAFRRDMLHEIQETFPTTTHFLEDKLILQSISSLQESDKQVGEDGIPGPRLTAEWNEPRLVGGLWGGSKKACIRWSWAYKSMLQEYFRTNRFAGKDQMVMLSTYIKNPSIARIVTHTIHDIDPWFFLEYLLSSLRLSYQLDPSYQIEDKSKEQRKIESL
jgi:hypothetical protein